MLKKIKVKKLITILLLSTIALTSLGQVENTDYSKGGFCSFKGHFYSIESGLSINLGGEAGFLIKDFRLGAYFEGMSKAAEITKDENIYKLRQSHGGIYFGYPFFNEHKFHLVTDIKIGYGNAKLIDANYDGYDKCEFITLIPSVAAEYSITEIFKVCFGINYQYHIKINTPERYNPSILNQPGIYLGFTLGLF